MKKLYPFVIGIPSLISAGTDLENHKFYEHEMDASLHGGLHFDKKYGRGKDDYFIGSEDHFDYIGFIYGGTTAYYNPLEKWYNYDFNHPISHYIGHPAYYYYGNYRADKYSRKYNL